MNHPDPLISRSPMWRGIRVILLVLPLACFALSPTVRAVDPPPDGGYPNGNTAEGDGALASLTTGAGNTAVGFQALFSNTSGGSGGNQAGNTAIGYDALFSNTIGSYNTANGYQALYRNTTGTVNTANGVWALFKNTTGSGNVAYGHQALYSNTTGYDNTATGAGALLENTTGLQNTANGADALESNSSGRANVANGYGALAFNSTGFQNTATGGGDGSLQAGALAKNTTGIRNTATGNQALFRNQTGNGNTAEGFQALANNTASFNVAVGFTAGSKLTTGHDNIDIVAPGVAGESNTMRIGAPAKQTATFIAGIRGTTTANANAVPVVIDSAGQLGTVSSSQRFKDNIKPMDNASEAIMALKPVTFHYKRDNQNTPQFGLIAEDVTKVNPDLVVRDENGEIYTVRYEAVNAMLLNEFLKEHRKVEEQQATITRLESKVAKQELSATQQQKQIEALAATVQKVSDQVALSKPAPQLVVANP